MLPFERPWTFAGKMSRNRKKKKKPKTEAAKTEATKAEGSQRPKNALKAALYEGLRDIPDIIPECRAHNLNEFRIISYVHVYIY